MIKVWIRRGAVGLEFTHRNRRLSVVGGDWILTTNRQQSGKPLNIWICHVTLTVNFHTSDSSFDSAWIYLPPALMHLNLVWWVILYIASLISWSQIWFFDQLQFHWHIHSTTMVAPLHGMSLGTPRSPLPFPSRIQSRLVVVHLELTLRHSSVSLACSYTSSKSTPLWSSSLHCSKLEGIFFNYCIQDMSLSLTSVLSQIFSAAFQPHSLSVNLFVSRPLTTTFFSLHPYSRHFSDHDWHHSALPVMAHQGFVCIMPMPTPGSSTAPLFKGQHVTDFLDSLEAHAAATNLSLSDLPGYVLRCCHFHICNIIELLTIWTQHNWALRAHLIDLYGSSNQEPQISANCFMKMGKITCWYLFHFQAYYRELTTQQPVLLWWLTQTKTSAYFSEDLLVKNNRRIP